MTFRGLGRQWKVSSRPWRPRHTHGRGSHDECYHFCRPGRTCALDQGGRARRRDRRGQIRDLRLRCLRRGRVDPVHRPRGQMRIRVGRDRVRPAEEALLPGRRLRRRRGVQDDQAQRRQAEEERPQRRGVPGQDALGGQHRRGVGARRRVRGRPRPGARPGRRPGGPEAPKAEALQVPAAPRARLRREDAVRPEEGQLDGGPTGSGSRGYPSGRRRTTTRLPSTSTR